MRHICVLVNLMLVLKNLYLISIYSLNKDSEGVTFRPQSFFETHGFHPDYECQQSMKEALELTREEAGNQALTDE